MSDSQTVWTVLWERAQRSAHPSDPFETSEVVPHLADRLQVTEKEASRTLSLLLGELSRMPEGRRFFRLEGHAVAPLPEFAAAVAASRPPLGVYPFEL